MIREAIAMLRAGADANSSGIRVIRNGYTVTSRQPITFAVERITWYCDRCRKSPTPDPDQ
jgi:hypothetical protein